jgi:hypothetical protein
MDPRFQTSFIPKKPIVAQIKSSSVSTINLFTLISTVIFITVVALSGGLFFYKGVVAKQIESDKATLDRARGAFEPELIAQITRLDTRIETARKLMDSHISVRPLFEFISSITLQSVRFRDFTFSYPAPDKIQVTMTGQAKNYASVALQSDVLNEQKNFEDVSISNMSLDGSGTISFAVSAIVNAKLLSYASTLNQSSVTPAINVTASSTKP